MSLTVNDFKWVKGVNDLEYIRLLEKALKHQQELTAKAIAKLKEITEKETP